MLEILKQVWGHDSLFPAQQEAIEALVGGQDVLLVLPTGGGKSLCYQLPAVALPGMAVVVSPLISLMRDQVHALQANGVAAASLDSSLDADGRRAVVARIRERSLKLLYLSPERLAVPDTARLLAEGRPSFVAVDEAHCVSQWGHEFRPEYRQIAAIREAFPSLAMLACTATATEAVRRDIVQALALRAPAVIVGSVDRPNLTYRALPRRDLLAQVEAVIARHEGDAGIVYCIRRADVDDLAARLAARGHRAVPYHAGLEPQARRACQDDFAAERVDIVVATVAFGMGIDRSNVRYVVHAGMPRSIESYQQEAGRAGRDGLEAECVVLYSPQDAATWRSIQGDAATEHERAALARIDDMYRYCRTLACRHRLLVTRFGERYERESCDACDVCLGEQEAVPDSTTLAKKLLSGVARVRERFGVRYVASVLAGSRAERIVQNGHDGLSTWGLLKDSPVEDIADWLDQLVGQDLLVREGEYGTLRITPEGWSFLRGSGTVLLARPRPAAARKPARARSSSQTLSPAEEGLFEALRLERRALAAARGVPAYIVLGDATLRGLASHRPSTVASLLEVRGIGERKAAEYGEALLAVIRRYCEEKGLPLAPGRPRAAAPSVAVSSAAARPAATPPAATPSGATPPGATPPAAPSDGRALRETAITALRSGASIEEVVRLTGRAQSTVEGYVVSLLEETRTTSPEPWATPDECARIIDACARVGRDRLKPIFEALGGTIPYAKIRVALAIDANRRAVPQPPDAMPAWRP
jgi:ATP-dependent DNA helicase RecQ